ncbi:MAG TPA: galactose oxidase [Candidatus Paceibacterota bacterium]|nr:galactose oxidase [Candidatus Paceibacterota bacterium]
MTASSLPLSSSALDLCWQQLPPLPDKVGFAGSFAGTSGKALIVAGGANFPDKMPWEGGVKIWHDEVFVLEHPEGPWKAGFKLPLRSGYGISVTADDSVVCIGGSDASGHLTNVFRLQWRQGKLLCQDLPPLPLALANACGALVGRSVYVAGGTDTPDASRALKKFLRLDLSNPTPQWEELTPWPGPARMLATAAAVDGSFFVVGGADLAPGPAGQPLRTYLKDGYRFTPGQGWRRVADMPNPVVAAPSPAPVINGCGFLVIGGDDGSLVDFQPRSQHPGFPKRVLHYDASRDQWSIAGETPAPRATLPTARWNGLHVIPSGEARPGVRSPEVWALSTR